MEVTIQPKIKFQFIGKNNIFAQYKIFGKEHDFNEKDIEIPEDIFIKDQGKKIVEFRLKPKSDKKDDEFCFYLYIYFGINKVYCFIDQKKGKLYDICFLDTKISSIEYDEFNLDLEYINKMTDDSRSRIVFINCPLEIVINQIETGLSNYIPPSLFKSNKSFQISFFDFIADAFSVKEIKPDENDEKLLIVEYIKEKQDNLYEFYDKLKEFIDDEVGDEKKFIQLFYEVKLEKKIFNFSQKKDVLIKELSDKKIYKLIYIYMLWLIYNIIFSSNKKEAIDNKDKNVNNINNYEAANNINTDNKNKNVNNINNSDKDASNIIINNKDKDKNNINNNDNNFINMNNNSKDAIIGEEETICNYSISEIFENVTKFYETYENDDELSNYQKVLLFCSNSIYYILLNDKAAYKNSGLNYIKFKNIKNNSVFGRCFQFLKDFINNLNNNSEIFYPLLLLDCGLYIHFNDPTYGFDFEKCEIIKEHLLDLLPEAFFIYEKKELLGEEKGFNFKGFKTIFLNKSTVLENYQGNPIEEDNNIKAVKHYATRSSKFFMHESFGHIKFIYQKKEAPSSPGYFYNKDKIFIEMTNKHDKTIENKAKNYFKINQRYIGGESGNFLDYFFGIFNNQLIMDLIYEINYIGKLIDNAKYFTEPNLETLKKYIIFKYITSEKNIEFEEKEDTNLKEDIIKMEEAFKKKGLTISQENQSKQSIPYFKEKKEESKSSTFTNISEIKNYSYYVKKIQESENNEESSKYYKTLLYKYLKIE